MAPSGATFINDLTQLIYASQPFGYDVPTLTAILGEARRFNEQHDVTGALVCRHDVYLQLLEGPTAQVEATFARIARDDRHANIQTLVTRQIPKRIFGDWAMLHDPAKSWIWTREEISGGILDRATPTEVIALFEALGSKAAAEG